MAKRKRLTGYEAFATMSREGQRANILSVAERCIDGAPVSLARKIEIYLAGETGPVDSSQLVFDNCKTFQTLFEVSEGESDDQ